MRLSTIPQICVITLFLPLSVWSDAHEPVVVMELAALAIEVENAPPTDGWVLERDVAGYQGDGYLRWAAPNAYNALGTGELHYHLLITESGRYQVRLRLNTAGAERSDLGNDAFTRFDDGPWVKTFVGGGSATGWATRTRLEPEHGKFAEPVYDLSVGRHTFAIAGRSHGLRVDRIVIWRDGGDQPSDTIAAVSGVPPIPDTLSDPAVRAVWQQGGLGAVLGWAAKRRKDPLAATVSTLLDEHATTRLTAITAWRDRDVLIAVDLLENLAVQYQGSERGRELAKLLRTWSDEPAVMKERKARTMASAVERLLGERTNERDPTRQQAMDKAIRDALVVMRRTAADTRVLTDLERRVVAAGLTMP